MDESVSNLNPECKYYDINTINHDPLFKNDLMVLHHNICSFRANFDELSYLLDSLYRKPPIIVLTETWFDENSVVDIDNYRSFHSYRDGVRGGGVSIYVMDSFESSLLEFTKINNNIIEACGVKVRISGGVFYNVVGIYQPPSESKNDFNNLLQNNILAKFSPSSRVFICGDMNIDLLNPTGHDNDYIDLFQSYSYIPLVNKPTREDSHSSKCIDHIWTNQLFEICSGIIDVNITDHYIIFFSIKCFDINLSYEIKFRDHSEVCLRSMSHNVDILVETFSNVDYDEVDFCTELFSRMFYDIYNKSCPIRKKMVSCRSFFKPWLDTSLKLDINRKHALYRDYKSGLIELNSYRLYRNLVSDRLRKAKSSYFKAKFNSISTDPKKTWNEINRIMNRKKKFEREKISLYEGTDNITSDSKKVCNIFNNHFSKVGINLNNSIPVSNMTHRDFLVNRNQYTFEIELTSTEEVKNLIHSLPNKKTDLFAVPILIHKICSNKISSLICNLFNRSVSLGIFPNINKVARIVPIFKSGDKCNVTNFRPISILSVLSKLFEKLICVRLSYFVDRFHLIDDNQFGFRKSRNTIDVINEFMCSAYECINQRTCLISLYLDFSKAFDTINHTILLDKLDHMGIRGVAGKWFTSYLENRLHYVSIGEVKSEKCTAGTGLPQGSNLAPLLFSLYINDMKNSCGSLKCLHFADDTTIYFPCKDPFNDIITINNQLKTIDEWLKVNKLALNISKTMYMIIGSAPSQLPPILIRNVPITLVNKIRFLGITVDNKLTFKEHVNAVVSKVSRSQGAIYRVSPYVTVDVLKKLYYSLMYSHMIYGVSVWGGASVSSSNKINKIQQRFLRLLPGNNDYKLIRINYNILNFPSIVKYFTGVKFYESHVNKNHPYITSIINDYAPRHEYSTRFSNNNGLQVPYCRTALSQKSFLYRSVSLWNGLSVSVKQANTLSIFKNQLKTHLLANQD